jgi:hypothetical protein
MHPRRILQFAAVAILAFGLGAAGCIYLLTDDSEEVSGGQVVIVDGTTYSVPANVTKRYTRDLQMFGGKAALVFDDLGRWFSGLWHGRALARTVLCLTLFASLALVMIARYFFPTESGNPHR